ncbi:MAG: hypothetical protein JOY78_18910 [Pseudonocardia sp.]|nr:hypothetical protein [Pseudonocardia sp.]
MTSHRLATPRRLQLNKVPQVTVYFWLIKILCTTVGETAADFLNVNLNLGLTGTSLVTGALLVLALVAQFRADRYRPGRYWTAVTLVSVFGTLVTDNLTDALGVPLEASTVVFAVLLAVTFGVWHRAERTLSIHTIHSSRREAFYWTAILVTFALGTAAGDLLAQVLGLGFLLAGLIVAAVIGVIAAGWRLGLHPVLAFWIIYVLTRPLGASIGDYLSQPASDGGLDLGATTTSLVFFAAIVGMVVYLAVTNADVLEDVPADGAEPHIERGGLWQTVVVVGLLLALGVLGYLWQTAALQADIPMTTGAATAGAAPSGTAGHAAAGAPTSHTRLGDLSAFRVITQDTLRLVTAGDQSGALARVRDLEIAWDDAEAHLKPRDKAAWTDLDAKIDKVLREVRAASPDPAGEKTALTTLLNALT